MLLIESVVVVVIVNHFDLSLFIIKVNDIVITSIVLCPALLPTAELALVFVLLVVGMLIAIFIVGVIVGVIKPYFLFITVVIERNGLFLFLLPIKQVINRF